MHVPTWGHQCVACYNERMRNGQFAQQVREALAHLHNRACLASLPLADWLGESGRPLSGDALRRLLVESIEQLKPVQSTPATLADWRRHQHLILRYVEGYNRDQVARELMISARQASRDHEQAIDALATMLWRRRVEPHASLPSSQPVRASESDAVASDARVTWDASTTLDSAQGDTDLSATINGALATLRKLLADRRVRIALSLPDILPPVAIDGALLRQALLHLLSYAVEVAEGGNVSLTGADTPPGVLLRIQLPSGRGPGRPGGRPAGALANIRELFEVGRDLLAAQGIALTLEGTADRPHSLTIVLPPTRCPTVLVIDDNPDLVGLFRRYLRGEPYRLIQSTSGTSALQLARDLLPDAIILDVMIPSLDGWDILNELRGTPELQDTTVIICSILPERALARELGVADFLAKPVTQPALLAVLRRWCPAPAARPAQP